MLLTQLLNRREFDEVHATCHAASQETPYCLVMIDIDHFKSINDEYGHAAPGRGSHLDRSGSA